MTTPNSIIADLSHEIDRLRRISNLLLEAAIRADQYIEMVENKTGIYVPDIRGELKYAVEEALRG